MSDTRFSISAFKDSIAAEGGFSRGVFYDCLIHRNAVSDSLTFRSATTNHPELYLCKAANLPSHQLDTTPIKYFTREIKVPAQRQISPLTLTFYNTHSHGLYDYLLEWLSTYNSPRSNVRNAKDVASFENSREENTIPLTGTTPSYGTIELFSKNDRHQNTSVFRCYEAFPTSIGGLQHSYENDTQVQTYDVEFQYLYSAFTTRPPKATVTTSEVIHLPVVD